VSQNFPLFHVTAPAPTEQHPPPASSSRWAQNTRTCKCHLGCQSQSRSVLQQVCDFCTQQQLAMLKPNMSTVSSVLYTCSISPLPVFVSLFLPPLAFWILYLLCTVDCSALCLARWGSCPPFLTPRSTEVSGKQQNWGTSEHARPTEWMPVPQLSMQSRCHMKGDSSTHQEKRERCQNWQRMIFYSFFIKHPG